MAREPDGAGARYSIREPVAVVHPVMVGPPFAGTNTTDAEGVSKVSPRTAGKNIGLAVDSSRVPPCENVSSEKNGSPINRGKRRLRPICLEKRTSSALPCAEKTFPGEVRGTADRLRSPGFPGEFGGVGGPHTPFLKRKAHTRPCLVRRGRKSGSG